jgi:hypothetical protein
MFGSFEPNRRTDVAIVNPLSQDVQVTLSAFDGNGGSVAPARTLTLSAFSQISAFLVELIGGFPSGFEGFVLLEAPYPVYAISISQNDEQHRGVSMVDLNQNYGAFGNDRLPSLSTVVRSWQHDGSVRIDARA